MSKQYWKIIHTGNRLEFHTGTDKDAVRKAERLNRAINLDAEPVTAQYVAEWVDICLYEVKLHSMEMA